jgi:hypothetical protein
VCTTHLAPCPPPPLHTHMSACTPLWGMLCAGVSCGARLTLCAPDATPPCFPPQISKRVHAAKNGAGKRARDSGPVSGPDFFGLSAEACARAIEALPGASACPSYVPLDRRPPGTLGVGATAAAAPGAAGAKGKGAASKKRPLAEEAGGADGAKKTKTPVRCRQSPCVCVCGGGREG